MKFTIFTQCAHCDKRIQIEIDSDLKFNVVESEANPMLFIPMVDFNTLDEPNIIHAF